LRSTVWAVTWAAALKRRARARRRGDDVPTLDDQQARKVRLLLLGKGVVSAHRIERPFAARLDDEQQS
jgi:hypothetical protein